VLGEQFPNVMDDLDILPDSTTITPERPRRRYHTISGAAFVGGTKEPHAEERKTRACVGSQPEDASPAPPVNTRASIPSIAAHMAATLVWILYT